ncbi:MAG TPA: M36 family metallopeptidase [Gaiella sp.]|nr:M36 family metallopeptidase [Gaiella sp.]
MDASTSSRRRRLRGALVCALTGVALFAASTASGVVAIGEIHPVGEERLDTRTASLAPSVGQLEAVERLGATVRFNEFGTPQSLVRYGGFLATGIEANGAAAAARVWLEANKSLFRLASLDGLELVGDRSLPGSRGHAVVFKQTFGSLVASPDGVLVVGVVGSVKRGWGVAYVSSRVTGDTAVEGSAELSATEAWASAAEAVGEDVGASEISVIGRQRGWTMLDVEGFEDPQSVRASAFPTPTRGVIRAYETTLVGKSDDGHDEGYWQIVEAETGRVLFRESVVDHAVDNPKWKVFPAYPLLTPLNRHPWNYPSADIRDPWCWTDAPGCRLELENDAARVPWDVDPRTGVPTLTTIGNAADAAENWLHPFVRTGTGYRPTSATRDYVYPWTNAWFESRCDPANFVVGSGNDIDAATANLFAMHNRMHDWSYFLGFTEPNWNAQDYNFGSPTLENDELIGNAQSGAVVGGAPNWAGRDNANMITRPDGERSETNMYLWQPIAGAFYAPCVDGDYDMAVIAHEYGHMIENRMIGKGNRRFGAHAGAMGESISDLFAMEYLNEYGLVPVGGENPYAVGAYVTGNADRGIRNYGMNFPTSGKFPQAGQYVEVNPLNLGAVGYDITGPQVHADGEIWSATNFDIRELFIERYGSGGKALQARCADGERPASACPGNRRWMQLYYDAMLLMPTTPTFLDARDAMLAADVIRFGGANQNRLWLAFAGRGFGQNASTVGPDDGDPIPDFASPQHQEGTLVFEAVSQATGAPVSANVFVGHYEGRVTPIADTDPGTAGPNLDPTASFVPDGLLRPAGHQGWEFVANAEGYGHVRFRVKNLRAGETRTVRIEFPTNVASVHQGAVPAGDGADHGQLVDDTEATGWVSTGAPVEGRQVVVDLAGGAQTFRAVKASAHLGPGQNRFVALRAFELYACTAGADPANPACDGATADGWAKVLTTQDDAFPGDNPRPVAPALILRSWNVPTTTATHVLFRVVSNQCTGQPSFQGEQDNDAANQTDCRTGSPPLPPRNTEVRAAELQVLTDRPRVAGAQQEE